MDRDGLADLRNSLRQATALRMAQAPAQPRVIEAFPSARPAPPEKPRLSVWQICWRVIPVVAAIVSTGLLAYFVLAGGGSPNVQLQQPQADHGQIQQAQFVPAQNSSGSSVQPSQPAMPERQAQAQQAQPQQQPAQAGAEDAGPLLPMPSDDRLVMLIMSSVVALNQANATENYTVLHALGAPSFKQANSPERLSQIFAKLRSRKLDLSPILIYQPKLYRAPELNMKGMLRITGFFPTEPERVNFDLIFQPVQGEWRLFGIGVQTSPAPQQARAPAGANPQGQAAKPAPAAAAAPTQGQAKAPSSAKASPPPPKPKPKESEAQTSGTAQAPKPSVDIRDRIDSPPPPAPAQEAPKQRNRWNPFSR